VLFQPPQPISAGEGDQVGNAVDQLQLRVRAVRLLFAAEQRDDTVDINGEYRLVEAAYQR
jgi:hypothetical protein